MARRDKKKPRYERQAPPLADCPVCGRQSTLDHLLAVEERIEAARGNKHPLFGWSVKAAQDRNRHLHWACMQCLARGVAVAADPLKQIYCCDTPYFAYADAARACMECGAEFTFRAAEQLHWYETLRFHLSSQPIRCAPCRKRRRNGTAVRAHIGEALAALDPNDAAQLAGVAALYEEIGSIEKAADYLRRAKNKARTQAQFLGLINKLESLQPRVEDTARVACPCCGFTTLSALGGFEICPVCFWQDDGQDDPHAAEVWGGPNGDLSLAQARKNYAQFGASALAHRPSVRQPKRDERRARKFG